MLSSRTGFISSISNPFTLSKRFKSKITIPLRCHIPLNSIPKQLQKKMNKAEKYLNSLGVRIEKIQYPLSKESELSIPKTAENNSDDSDDTQLKESIIDHTNPLIVGSIHQYPHISHYNESVILQIFGKNRLSKSSWSFDSKIRENYNVPLSVNEYFYISSYHIFMHFYVYTKTAIDYYPFRNTFSEHSKPKKSKKQSFNQSENKWKIRRKGYNIRCRDSFDDKLPRLSRVINANGDEQHLIIYRDVPYDLNSAISVLPIIKEYEPDIIVFEYGRLPFFDKYIEKRVTFSNLMLPLKKIFASVTPFKLLQIGLGKTFYSLSKKLYKTEISSYAFESSLDFVARTAKKKNKRKIPLIAGDLHHKITDSLRVFNDYLDLYNIATLIHYGIVSDKFIKASTRVKLGDNLANIIQMRLYPHMTAMNVYRNDILSCVLNEIDGDKYGKILLISQAMRLKDLFDKLCGFSVIHKWIKSMEDGHVLMNKLNLFESKIGCTNEKNTYLCNVIESEYEEEIIKSCSYLGHEQTAFLLEAYPLRLENDDGKKIDFMSNDLKEEEFVEKLKEKIAEKSQQLKRKYS